LDEVILLDIYPARELPIPGVDSQMIAAMMQQAKVTLCSKSELMNELKSRHIEVLLTVGAGDIDTFTEPIRQWLSAGTNNSQGHEK